MLTSVSPQRTARLLMIAVALVLAVGATACSSTADVAIAAEADGGIGDGAAPLPGADEPADEGTWHGAEVATTNCPGMEWHRVQASAFSFSVPADFVDQSSQGADSEIGRWSRGDEITVSYDYGWYSGSIGAMAGVERERVDFSGIAGQQSILRDEGRTMVEVFFDEVQPAGTQWERLGLVVTASDPADEIIGRCIVGSIEWDF